MCITPTLGLVRMDYFQELAGVKNIVLRLVAENTLVFLRTHSDGRKDGLSRGPA